MTQPNLFCSYTPGPPLDRFVDFIWYWEGPEQRHAKERLMPTGAANIIVNLCEDEVREYVGERGDTLHRHTGAILVGARSSYSIIDTAEQRTVLGLSFRPGGTWPFFDVSADELCNLHVALDDIWGAGARSLREQILLAPTPMARLRTMEKALASRAIRPLAQHPAIAFSLARMHLGADPESVEVLSNKAGLSGRRLARLFSLEVGLTPKLYARVLRFGRALQLTHADRPVDWSDVVHQCGYFDQSHLIHDFRKFSGFTPSEYLARRTPFSNHVRI
jgi:AraC-like DNA-binding protein